MLASGAKAMAALVLACVAGGCTCGRGTYPPLCGQSASTCEGRLVAAGDVSPLEPDMTALASYQLSVGRTVWPGEITHYRVLEAAEAQCCAAANDGLANAIAAERRRVEAEGGCTDAQRRINALKACVLAHRAVERRNLAAARGLEAFYLLAEAEANRDLGRDSLDRIEKTLDHFDRLQTEGMEIPGDRDETFRRRLALLDRQAQLDLSLKQLNSSLHQLVGLHGTDTAPIWPAADVRVAVHPMDVEAEVALGLAHRPDVNLLRTLSQSLDRKTLVIARLALSQLDAALGTSPTIGRLCKLLQGDGQECEVEMRRRQLYRLRVDTERAAAAEIRQAAYAVQTRLDQIAVAKSTRENWQKRVASLKLLRSASGGPTAFEIEAAELQAIQAQSDLIHQVIAWRLAQVKLREAQGLLAYECGYDLPRCGFGCCLAAVRRGG